MNNLSYFHHQQWTEEEQFVEQKFLLEQLPISGLDSLSIGLKPLSDSLIFIVFRTGSEWNDQILAKLHLERIWGSKIDTIGPERSLELNLIISDGLQHFSLFKILENQILKLNPGPVRRSLVLVCSRNYRWRRYYRWAFRNRFEMDVFLV